MGHLSLTDWSWQPTVLTGLLLCALAYAGAWRRGWLRSDDDVTPWLPRASWRPWMFGAGLAVALVALQSPIDEGGDRYLFSLHMLQHLLLMMVSPPLALLGLAGMRVPSTAFAPRLRATWGRLVRPWPACAVFNAVLLVWHIPVLYDTTLTVDPVHIVEHVTFVAAGMLLWWPVVDPMRLSSTRMVSPLEKIAMLTVSGIPPTALGFIFALARSPIYTFYARAPRLWGISAVLDQQVAGVLMFGLGNIIYFIAISAVFLRLFGHAQEDEAPTADTAETARPALP